MNDTTRPVIMASTSLTSFSDAAMIAACGRYLEMRAEYNSATEDRSDEDEAKIWARLSACEKDAFGAPALTMEGVLARARAADISGHEEKAFQVVEELLRITGAAVDVVAGLQHSVDAELVLRCDEYLRLSREFEANESATCEDDDPLWQAVSAAEDACEELEPQTLAGIMALCHVATHQATQPDGSLNYGDSFTGDYPARVIEALLRLSGPPAPAAASRDARIIKAATKHRAAAETFYDTDEHRAPKKYLAAERRYHATLKAMVDAPAPSTMAGFREMAGAILADATDPDGNVTVQTLQASQTTQRLILKLLEGLCRR